MDIQELKKVNGDVYFMAERRGNNAYIFVNWTGIQTLDMMMLGAQLLLKMLRHQPCQVLLNSNQEVIGPWDDGALFLGSQWARQAKALGLRNFIQVQAHGVYGKKSFKLFHQYGQQHLEIQTFDSLEDGEAWIKEFLSPT